MLEQTYLLVTWTQRLMRSYSTIHSQPLALFYKHQRYSCVYVHSFFSSSFLSFSPSSFSVFFSRFFFLFSYSSPVSLFSSSIFFIFTFSLLPTLCIKNICSCTTGVKLHLERKKVFALHFTGSQCMVGKSGQRVFRMLRMHWYYHGGEEIRIFIKKNHYFSHEYDYFFTVSLKNNGSFYIK